MSDALRAACEILTACRHCDAEWSVAFDGSGRPHAHGWHWTDRRQYVGISLDAEAAIGLAAAYGAAPCPAPPSSR